MRNFPPIATELADAFTSPRLFRGRVIYDEIEIYLRVGPRWTGYEEIEKCLVLADASLTPTLQREGRFRRFLAEIDMWMSTRQAAEPAVVMGILCEGVFNAHLVPVLLRRGYRPTENSYPIAPDLYRLIAPMQASTET